MKIKKATDMKNKKIIVTGGSGFIGSSLTRHLSSENKIIVIDDLSTGNLSNIQDLIDNEKIEFIKGSVLDRSLLEKNFKDVDYVFHEAAIPSVPKSIKDPITTNKVNIEGTLNVLIAARDNNVSKVVYASSSSIYGDDLTLPKKEEMKPYPMSPYAIQKLTGEYYCQVFSEIFDLPTVSLRYFNVYGPRQDPANDYAAVIPKFIFRALNDKLPIIYGDGTQSRDFSFISDVINANILAAESKTTGVFNIANGDQITITDLAKCILKIMNKNLEIKYDDPRPGDIMHSFADISKAKEEIKFEPKFDLTEGVEKTVHWFKCPDE